MISTDNLKAYYNTEQVLVILLARRYFNTAQQNEVVVFKNNEVINWDLFYEIIKAHRIRAFIYAVLKEDELQIPVQYEQLLKQHALATAANNIHQINTLVKIMEELSAIGLNVIPYKGVSFASAYYQRIDLREGSDIDLLVDKADVPRIRAFFYAKNYQPKTDVPVGYLKYFITFFKEIAFTTPENASGISCSVEVQWRLIDRNLGNFEPYSFFSSHIMSCTYKNRVIHKLSPTYDLLCTASNHLIKDPLFSFKYAIDLACLLHQSGQEIDTSIVKKIIAKFKYEGIFTAGLTVVADLLGIQMEGLDLESNPNRYLMDAVIAYPLLKKKGRMSRDYFNTLLLFDKSIISKISKMAILFFYIFLPQVEDIKQNKLTAISLPLLFLLKPFRLCYKFVWKKNT